MTRIHTNLSSLLARHQLGGITHSLADTTRRLATGLRINAGRDDPAGLIASESLRRRSESLRAGINNIQRASQYFATVEGALAEVSSLLLDVKGLVNQTANSGGLSEDEIASNQLELDAALASIDRIAANTAFGDTKPLDGSGGYMLSGVGDMLIPVNRAFVSHALVPSEAPLPVVVEIQTEGQRAEQTWTVTNAFLKATQTTGSNIELTSDQGTQVINFSGAPYTAQDVVDDINDAQGVTGVEATLVGPDQILFRSLSYGTDAALTLDAEQPAAAYWRDSANFLSTVQGDWLMQLTSNLGGTFLNLNGPQTPAALVAAINAATGSSGLHVVYEGGDFIFTSTSTGNVAAASVSVQRPVYFSKADSPDVTIANGGPGTPATYTWADPSEFIADAAGGTATLRVAGPDGTQDITLGPGVITGNDIANAVAATSGTTGVTAVAGAGAVNFSSLATGSGVSFGLAGLEKASAQWNDRSAFLNAATYQENIIRVTGALGTQELSFNSGAFTDNDIVNAVNGVQGLTGVSASLGGGVITFTSTVHAPAASIDVLADHRIPALTTPIDLSENRGAEIDVTTAGGDSAVRVNTINFDPRTQSNGTAASLDTRNLGVDLFFDDFVGMSVGGKGGEGLYSVYTEFYVTGGGSDFNVSPDEGLGGRLSASFPSIHTEYLGSGLSGFLNELKTGFSNDLASGNLETAATIVDDAIEQIAELRGEIGTTLKYDLEAFRHNHQVSLENTLAAESAIRDADFAAETARLTRAQILRQAVTQSLLIANDQPRQLLPLLAS